MPLRMLIAQLQHQRAEQDNDANQAGSESEAQSNALTNAINVVGIPIKNTVSGTHTASTSAGHSGSFKEQFSIGNLGITAGLNSEQVGTGLGLNRKPGEIGLHLGALNFGFTNHAGDNKNTETIASSSATGGGAISTSQTDTHSNSYVVGHGAVNIQNTVSSSQAHSTSLTGTTSAAAEAANSATQNSQIANTGPANPIQYQQYQHQPNVPQPDVTQQNSQLPFVEIKLTPQPGLQQTSFQQPGTQMGFQLPQIQQLNFQQPGYQGIEKL